MGSLPWVLEPWSSSFHYNFSLCPHHSPAMSAVTVCLTVYSLDWKKIKARDPILSLLETQIILNMMPKVRNDFVINGQKVGQEREERKGKVQRGRLKMKWHPAVLKWHLWSRTLGPQQSAISRTPSNVTKLWDTQRTQKLRKWTLAESKGVGPCKHIYKHKMKVWPPALSTRA